LNNFADLEISLALRDETTYTITGRLTLPNSDTDSFFGYETPILFQVDPLELADLILTPDEYGKQLAEAFFKDPGMADLWAKASASAQANGSPLRLRLLISASAAPLNELYWESLRDLQDGAPLFTGERVLFSRYLSANDLRPVKLRPKGDLKALVMVAAPEGLESYKLAPVDREAEMERARAALGDVPITFLPAKKDQRTTLQNIVETLRDGYDIFYLVAHGTLTSSGEPMLWLENDEGQVERVLAAKLAEQVNELQHQPRLAILASCQSAGKGAGNSMQAIGPRLSQAGIPAVIAMQGNISMASVKKFMPMLFNELQRDGQIDRALAVARGSIRDSQDFWMPVLFMRLRSGKVWYVPGLGEEGEFDKWPTITAAIQNEKCTPILGPGLYEPMIGSWQDFSIALAKKFNFPLASFHQDALPHVTQFVASNQSLDTLFLSLNSTIRKIVQNRFGEHLPENLHKPNASLLDLLKISGQKFREKQEYEQHKVLASLPLPFYITTNYNNMLAEALEEAGRKPEVVICPWSERFYSESVYDNEPDYRPTVERPLVYHLFGHLKEPESMVLTEDDYYEFLIGFTTARRRTPAIIPPLIARALTDSNLLILGFQLNDWTFRALFRIVMSQQGGARRGRYAHIGVQVELDDTRNMDTRRARKFIEKYFGDSEISIYWGKSEDFIEQLARKWKAAQEE
jgi:hypothetical protein